MDLYLLVGLDRNLINIIQVSIAYLPRNGLVAANSQGIADVVRLAGWVGDAAGGLFEDDRQEGLS